MSEELPVKVGDLVDVLVSSRNRAQGVLWMPARIRAIEDNPHNPGEKVFRIETLFGSPFVNKWAYRRSSIRRMNVFGAIVEFSNTDIEKINPYAIKYEYDTSLDPNDPPTPFNKDEFLKSMIALSELSQRGGGVGGDTGLVVTLPKGAQARMVAPEKSVKEMIEDAAEQIDNEAEENRKKKGK